MMKQPTEINSFKAKRRGLLSGLGLFILACGPLWAAAPEAPAPAPAAPQAPPVPFNADANPPEGAAAGAPSPAWVLGQTPTAEAQPTPDGSENGIAAPQPSEDVLIRNGMEMAYQAYHAEDYESAGKAAAQIVERYPKKALYWVRYLEALALEHQDLYQQAIDQYEKVKELAPHSTYANAATFRLGLCQLKSGQEQEAVYTLRDIIENNPRSEYRLQAYVHLGNLYRRNRDWRAAQRIYKDLIHLYPNTSWAYLSTLYLAETHAHQGHNDTAVHVYQGMLRDARIPLAIRAQAQLRIGDLYISDQKWLEALDVYRIALRDYSKVPGVTSTAEQKILVATEGRRSGRLPYHPVGGPRGRSGAPADADYRLKHQQESVPYED